MSATIYGIDDANVGGGTPIQASKLQGEFSHDYSQTGTVQADTRYLGVVRGSAGTTLSLMAAIPEAIATGADRTVTLDLQRSTGAGAFASVLSAPLSFGNADTLRLFKSASVTTGALQAGDLLRLVVTVAGVAGAQAQGLVATVQSRESPS